MSESGILFEEGNEVCADVAEVPGLGAAGLEIGDGEAVEFAFAEDGAEAAEIFGEGPEQSPPVLLVVDLEALEGGEAVVGFDEAFGDSGAGGLHAFVAGERTK